MTKAVGVNSSYQYITEHTAKNITKGRGGYGTPKAIVIHHWNDPSAGTTFDGVVNWFCYNSSCTNSAHYVVEGGRVACVVSPHDTSWHAGNWDMNQKSIGIECSPYQTDADYETAGEFVADLWLEWGKLPLYRHKDVSDSPTACPGTWNLNRIQEIAERHFNGNDKAPEPEGAGIIPDEPPAWGADAWKQATQEGIVDGTRPNDNLTRVEYAASELRRK